MSDAKRRHGERSEAMRHRRAVMVAIRALSLLAMTIEVMEEER